MTRSPGTDAAGTARQPQEKTAASTSERFRPNGRRKTEGFECTSENDEVRAEQEKNAAMHPATDLRETKESGGRAFGIGNRIRFFLLEVRSPVCGGTPECPHFRPGEGLRAAKRQKQRFEGAVRHRGSSRNLPEERPERRHGEASARRIRRYDSCPLPCMQPKYPKP